MSAERWRLAKAFDEEWSSVVHGFKRVLLKISYGYLLLGRPDVRSMNERGRCAQVKVKTLLNIEPLWVATLSYPS